MTAIYWRGITNRRKQLRYPLKASIRYHWRDPRGLLCYGRGLTRDVSERGVLVAGANCPSQGDLVKATIRVRQAKKAGSGSPLSLSMSGEVVRVLVDAAGKAVCGFAMERRDQPRKKAGKATNCAARTEDSEGRRWN